MLYWRRRLTRLELAIYAALAGIVLAIFLERMLYYMELAERTAMETTVSNVNSGLHVRQAYDMLSGRPANDPRTLARNPFDLVGMTPRNFHGEMDSPGLADLERGYWVFDRARTELIYLPRLRRGLKTGAAEEAIHFKLAWQRNAIYVLAPTSEYLWN